MEKKTQKRSKKKVILWIILGIILFFSIQAPLTIMITEGESFDTQTVAGAIEYVIAYSKETWDCPVIFYTGTKYDNEHYADMVDLLLKIQEKWGIGVIDLWNNTEMNAVSEEDYKLYMVNGIHPSRAGYLEWWTPVMEEYLIEYLGEVEE